MLETTRNFICRVAAKATMATAVAVGLLGYSHEKQAHPERKPATSDVIDTGLDALKRLFLPPVNRQTEPSELWKKTFNDNDGTLLRSYIGTVMDDNFQLLLKEASLKENRNDMLAHLRLAILTARQIEQNSTKIAEALEGFATKLEAPPTETNNKD